MLHGESRSRAMGRHEKVEYELPLHSIFHPCPPTVLLMCFVKSNFVLDSDLSGEDKGLQVGNQLEVVVYGGDIGREDYAFGSHDGVCVVKKKGVWGGGWGNKEVKCGEMVILSTRRDCHLNIQ